MTEEEKILYIKSMLEKKRTIATIDEVITPILEKVDREIKEVKDIKLIHGIDGKNGIDGKHGTDGKDGNTPIKGKDYFDGEKGDKGDSVKGEAGKDGYTPVKGKDYFDGKDGYTPIKGKDYKDGTDGTDGTGIKETEIQGGDLLITFSNGKKSNLGRVKGASGSNGRPADHQVYSGTTIPDISLGVDGDLYFKI